ncbi:MAG TPA: hypothetical protein VFV94_05055 [Polyangiaceae bacterium]|nr:hypothetical protein [Polyangiaceae bacterium]
MFGELGYWHSEPASLHANVFRWILGAGFKVAPNVELEAFMPMTFAEAGSHRHAALQRALSAR